MDTEGFPIRVLVHSANESDKTVVKWVLRLIPVSSRWQKVIVDSGYDSPAIAHHCQSMYGVEYEIVERTGQGFQVLPKRWVVERTFAWFGKYRRLSKDYEQKVTVSAATLYYCSIHILVRRLAKLLF